MTDRRNALEKHLGLSADRTIYGYDRSDALKNHVGDALDSENYAAAQVYALLLIAEELAGSSSGAVTVTNADEIAGSITNGLSDDLRRIADAVAATI
jgi:hypothetical protein